MKKLMKYVGGILLSTILVAAVAITLFIKLVDPNFFKPMITAQLKKTLDREVAIQGNLGWSFYPDFGIKLERIFVKGKNEPAINIAHANVNLRILPLIHRQLDIAGVYVDGINMPQYHIKNASLKSSNATSTTFPVKLNFDYQVDKAQVKTELEATLRYNASAQTLTSDDVHFSFSNLNADGNIKVTNLNSSPNVTGAFDVDAKDLTVVMNQLSDVKDIIQTADGFKGKINLSANEKTIKAEGDIALGTLVVNHIKLTNLRVATNYNNNVVNLTKINANLYQGEMLANARINLGSETPTIAIKSGLMNVRIEDLLRDLSDSKSGSVIGSANVNLNVQSQGLDKTTFLRNLNGTGNINIAKGAFVGLDMNALISNARNLVTKKDLSSGDPSAQSQFDNATGTFTINNGVIQMNDLNVTSSNYVGRGQGRIDLPGSWINYVLYVQLNKNYREDDLTNLYGINIPIAIRGNLTDPKISVDAGQLLQAIVSKRVERTTQDTAHDAAQDAAQQILNKLLN